MDRFLLAAFAALGVALAILGAGGVLGTALFPIAFGAAHDGGTAAMLAQLPLAAKLGTVLLWFGAAIAAAAVAQRIARHWSLAFAGCGWTFAALAGGVIDFPHAEWMLMVALALPAGAALLVVQLIPAPPPRWRPQAALRAHGEALYRGA